MTNYVHVLREQHAWLKMKGGGGEAGVQKFFSRKLLSNEEL